jgi:hypothetical protein
VISQRSSSLTACGSLSAQVEVDQGFRRSDHVGLVFLMVFMLLGDVLSTRYFVESVQKYGPSVHIMFAFEVRTLQLLLALR